MWGQKRGMAGGMAGKKKILMEKRKTKGSAFKSLTTLSYLCYTSEL